MGGIDFVSVLATFFHDLFTVIWMGGLIVTVISYLPAIKESIGPGPQVKKVMQAYQKRQSVWVYISMAGLIVTGLMLSKQNPDFVHLFNFSSPYASALSIKHILVIIMIGISLERSLILGSAKGPTTPQKERLNLILLMVNAGLAVVVLFTSGFIAALA
ncbi:MAG: hypothetical protein ACYC6H_12450 [Bellilinea sp.]